MSCYDSSVREKPTLLVEPLDIKCRLNRQFVIRGRNSWAKSRICISAICSLANSGASVSTNTALQHAITLALPLWVLVPEKNACRAYFCRKKILGTERVRAAIEKSMKTLLSQDFSGSALKSLKKFSSKKLSTDCSLSCA